MSDFALQFVPDPTAAQGGERPQTNLLEQSMSGLNEGFGIGLGLPVDLVTGGINAVTGGINRAVGTNIGQITDPVGGGDFFQRLLAPTISNVEPQTGAQRYARRGMREIGAGVPVAAATMAGGPLAAAARSAPATYMAGNAVADFGSGISGQLARDVAPDGAGPISADTLDLIASILGGTVSGATYERAARTTPQIATRADVEARTNRLYDAVENSGANLTPQAQQDFSTALRNRFTSEGEDAFSAPKANAQLNRLEQNPRASIMDVEVARRKLRDRVARSATESDIGADLVDEIETYLNNLTPSQLTTNAVDPQDVVADLQKARSSAHQGIKHDEIMDALKKAERQTEASGTGGNTLNKQSQAIGPFYDREASLRKPQLSGGYTDDEIEAMRQVVFPSGGENFLRKVGRWAPGTGALSSQLGLYGGLGSLATAAATQNPLYALPSIAPLVGSAAQSTAEAIKRRKIEQLIATILNDGARPQVVQSDAAKAAIASQLLSQGGAQ